MNESIDWLSVEVEIGHALEWLEDPVEQAPYVDYLRDIWNRIVYEDRGPLPTPNEVSVALRLARAV